MIVPCLVAALVGVLRAGEPPLGESAADRFAGNACVHCHEDLPGRLGSIVSLEWKESVHYANGVACDGCHGGDPAVRREQFATLDEFKNAAHMARDPKFLTVQAQPEAFVSRVRGREVSYFCGKCHALVKEKHLGSPHGNNGDPTCLYCHARGPDGHGTHRIVPAALDIIDTRGREAGGRCSPCHQAPTMQAVGQIKATLAKTAGLIDGASRQYEELTHRGYRSLELAGLQQHGLEIHSQLRRVFHSFDMREITNFAGEIQGLAERTDRVHTLIDQVIQKRRRQTLVGLGVTSFLLCFVGLLLYYKKTFCLEHAEQLMAHPH